MSSKGLTTQEYFQSLRIIYFALLSGIIIMGGVFYFLNLGAQPKSDLSSLEDWFLVGVSFIILAGILGGSFIRKNKLRSIREKSRVIEKLGDYRSIFVVTLALLEGPAMIALIGYFLTTNYLFLAFVGMVIIVYLSYMPSKSKIAKELDLSQSEKSFINNPEQIVAEVTEK